MTSKVNKFCIQGGHVLLPSGETQETDIVISEGRIDAIGVSPAKTVKRIDASGCMVLPGIVDLHGDAFERQIMPRPGVTFPLELAFLDTDRQLVCKWDHNRFSRDNLLLGTWATWSRDSN